MIVPRRWTGHIMRIFMLLIESEWWNILMVRNNTRPLPMRFMSWISALWNHTEPNNLSKGSWEKLWETGSCRRNTIRSAVRDEPWETRHIGRAGHGIYSGSGGNSSLRSAPVFSGCGLLRFPALKKMGQFSSICFRHLDIRWPSLTWHSYLYLAYYQR